MQRHYQGRELDAKEWKRNGGKVIGYFCDSVPEELILAAGLFPLRLSGNPWSDTKKADECNPLPSEAFVSSMLNGLLTDRYDFLDFLVIPRVRTSIHGLYSVLNQAKSAFSDLSLPDVHFLDYLYPVHYSHQVYNRDSINEFKKKLEEWSGKEIINEALANAIAVTNENKSLLKKVAALRAAEPPRVSGIEAIQIIGSSMFMLKEEHNTLLKNYLEASSQLPTRDGVRLFVEASPLDNLQLYQIIEACDAIVVGEDNCWGNRYSDIPIDISLPPMTAIIDRYLNKSPCPWCIPLSRRVNYCVGSAIEAKAQGAIINVYELDDTLSWEIPDDIKALKQKDIPSLHLRNQPYFISEPEKLKIEVREFIDLIRK